MQFCVLKIGKSFDFINDKKPGFNSFYDRCIKISPRRYQSISTGIKYTVGSINAEVFHVSSETADELTAKKTTETLLRHFNRD